MADGVVTGCGDCFSPIIMAEVSELRRDVAKTEADLKAFEAREFCDLGHKVSDEGSMTRLNLANAERDLQNRIHETRIEALKANTELSRYLSDKTDLVKEQMRSFQVSVDEKFCDVKSQVKDSERRILDQLAADKLDEKNEVIEGLRHERYWDKTNANFAYQNQEIANLKNMINSVEQTQKFASKTVQFGAGNVAIPTQTANQG